MEDSLEFEAVLRPADRIAKQFGELGEGLKFLLVRSGMHSAEERYIHLCEVLGDRLVGRKHELSMIWWLRLFSEKCAGNAAVRIELQDGFGHNEFERPAA